MFTRSNLQYFPFAHLEDESTPVSSSNICLQGSVDAFPFCKRHQSCSKGKVSFTQKLSRAVSPSQFPKIITVGSLLYASGSSCTWLVNGDQQECQQPGQNETCLNFFLQKSPIFLELSILPDNVFQGGRSRPTQPRAIGGDVQLEKIEPR